MDVYAPFVLGAETGAVPWAGARPQPAAAAAAVDATAEDDQAPPPEMTAGVWDTQTHPGWIPSVTMRMIGHGHSYGSTKTVVGKDVLPHCVPKSELDQESHRRNEGYNNSFNGNGQFTVEGPPVWALEPGGLAGEAIEANFETWASIVKSILAEHVGPIRDPQMHPVILAVPVGVSSSAAQ